MMWQYSAVSITVSKLAISSDYIYSTLLLAWSNLIQPNSLPSFRHVYLPDTTSLPCLRRSALSPPYQVFFVSSIIHSFIHSFISVYTWFYIYVSVLWYVTICDCECVPLICFVLICYILWMVVSSPTLHIISFRLQTRDLRTEQNIT